MLKVWIQKFANGRTSGFNMKRFPTGFFFLVLMLAPVRAEEVPFADPFPSEPAVGTLANIMMGSIQPRHIKLWFIGKAKNWDLLNYEAQKLERDFYIASGFYKSLPIDNITLVATPLRHLKEATNKRDYSLYTKAFDELTAGCNSCHVAAQVRYIRIQVPKSSSPFSNQNIER